ncbi:MAG TPA: tRNA (guanosine(46)-N7)-methyltransferase TrmB [Polyangia bacterium]|jgi:tRNA (guanine-N7-)-methyltransferase|nr:tRNA (guanosine(46)-N7)-methyltransferase TrmB [Polyangia bacterium]
MAKRLRHHVNPLKGAFVRPNAAAVPLPASGEVEVELGCADAQFLFARAAAEPALICIGVEIRREMVEEVNRRALASGLGNLRAVFANINVDLPALFPAGRLARVFINFPDPWFKRRHHKRRVMTPEVARVLAEQLSPGGILFFQSDVFDLALEAMVVLEEVGETLGLRNQAGPWSFIRDNPWNAKSLREVRCEERGMRIWRLLYRREPAPATPRSGPVPGPLC